MSKLDIMKKELELKRVEAAQFDMEIRIEEHKAEIERLEGHIKIQKETAEKLQQTIKELKEE